MPKFYRKQMVVETIIFVTIGMVLFIGFILFIVLLTGLKTVREYERLVIYYLGRYNGSKGPGLIWIWPIISKTQRVDLRETVIDVPRQEAITADNVPVFVNAIVKMRITDPGQAVNNVLNVRGAITQMGMTTLRAIIGKNTLDVLLQQRDRVNDEIRSILDAEVEHWGIEVSLTEVKDLDIPDQLKRAMARQAEAERERRARVILAEGEAQASEKIVAAGEKMGKTPAALMLRFLQTIGEVSLENASTVVLPFPIELLSLSRDVSKLTKALDE